MQFDNLRTLVLTSNFMPVSIFPDLETISVKVAIASYLDDKCEVVHFYDTPIMVNGVQAVHPTKGPLFWPSVIMYKNAYTTKKVMRLCKENLYLRDHFACVYCGDPLQYSTTTMDHLIPKSKGGHKKSWLNMVASCHKCNQRKSDDMPGKQWIPSRKPYIPTFYDLLEARKKKPLVIDDESWLMFLPKWEAEVIVRKDRKPLEATEETSANDNGKVSTKKKKQKKAV